jgi:galactose oxidase-like protein
MRTAAALVAAILLAGCGDERRANPPLRMLDARAVHTATALGDGTVLLAGGCATAGCSTATRATELFDGRRFRPGPRLVVARDGHTATPLPDDGVLLAGGFEREGTPPLASAEVVRERVVQPAPAMRTGRGGHVAAQFGAGVLVAGGSGASGVLRSAEVFDGDRWRSAAPMRHARVAAAATSLPDGSVLVTGGIGADGKALRSVERFDGRRWHPAPPMRTARGKHAAVALDDGRTLVLGGARDDEHGSELRSAEIFDGERWQSAGRMAAARYKITDAVVRLPDGRVLVAGGAPALEIFDPPTRRFTTLRRSVPARLFATATALPDGRALVAGGYDDAIQPSAAAALIR